MKNNLPESVEKTYQLYKKMAEELTSLHKQRKETKIIVMMEEITKTIESRKEELTELNKCHRRSYRKLLNQS